MRGQAAGEVAFYSGKREVLLRISRWMIDFRARITIDPDKRGGKPCFRGLRITVYDVLEYLASGMSLEAILDDFPDLEREDIYAALAFAADRERKLSATYG